MLPFSDCFKESHEIENDEHTMSYQIHKVIENACLSIGEKL
jgi:hypothetical protein